MKKVISIILVVLMLMTVLVGCGNNGTESSSNVDLTKYPSGYNFEEGKYAGETLYIWTGQTRNASNEEIIAEFERGTGAKVEFVVVPYIEGLSAYATAIISGKGIDFMAADNRQFPSWIIKKLISPVSTVLDLSDSFYQDSGLIVQGTSDFWTYKGEIYGFLASQFTACGYLVYNKSMFEEAGLDDPYELYKKGEWNFETMKEALAALTYDSDEDGLIDKYGLTGYLDGYWIGCAGGDANYVRYDSEGRPQFAIDDPDIIECYEYYRELVENQYFKVVTTPDADFAEGTAAMYGGVIEWGSANFIEYLGVENIGFVAFPAAPSNTSGVSNSLIHSAAYAIPACVSDTALLKEWIDYSMFWTRADIEGDAKQIALEERINSTYGGNEEWYNFNVKLLENTWIPNGDSYGELANLCNAEIFWKTEGTVSSLVQAIAPAAQAEIDSVFYDMTEE